MPRQPSARVDPVDRALMTAMGAYPRCRSTQRIISYGMESRTTTTGYFSGVSIISLVGGVGFFCVSFILWWFLRYKALVLFGAAMLFGGLANSLACLVLHRMHTAGYDVGYWRWFSTDLEIYSEYWRTASSRGWSRSPLVSAIFCFLVAAMFLLSIAAFTAHPFAQ